MTDARINVYADDKLKQEFLPGNLFKDITLLAEAIDGTNMNTKLTRYFFQFYDRNGDGTIDRTELGSIISDIGEAMGDADMQNISTKQLDDAMAILDTDNNGQVDWLEFKTWFDQLMRAEDAEEELDE